MKSRLRGMRGGRNRGWGRARGARLRGNAGPPLRDPQPPRGTAIFGPAAEAPPVAESSGPARGGSGGSAPSGASPRRRHGAASPVPASRLPSRAGGWTGAERSRGALPARPVRTHALRGRGMGLRGGGGRAGRPAPGWTCLLLCAALRSLLASPGSEGERGRGGRWQSSASGWFYSLS